MSYGPGLYEINWQFYETQEDLLGSYWRDPGAMPMAVVFHSDDPYGGPLKYEIRTNPSFVVTPPTTQLFSSQAVCRQTGSTWSSVFPIEAGDSCPSNQYYYSGFVALQALLDYTKIRVSLIGEEKSGTELGEGRKLRSNTIKDFLRVHL